MTRRDFLARTGMAAGALAASGSIGIPRGDDPPFLISLAQWSLHRELRAGELDNLDFASVARSFGIDAIEYVSVFFKDKAKDTVYLDEMNKRAADHGVDNVLIMCDHEGRLGDPDADARAQAVMHHHKWIDAALRLGCHSIRVNAASEGTYEEQQRLAADGLRTLTEYGAKAKINVIVENHGGWSSNGQWLAEVIRMVDHPRCGTLPDFGNFCMDWSRKDDPDMWYDRYKGVRQLMPYAKGVSAKSYDFDDKGEETTIDYGRLLRIVTGASYHGRVGIEYEGDRLSERDGIAATKRLLERVRETLAR